MSTNTPVNSRDTALQALPQRLVSLNTNFISLASPYLEFVYGINDTASPEKITITAQLAGELQGIVEWVPTGLKANTVLNKSGNSVILDPSTFAGQYITIAAKLEFNGVTYTSNSIVISKRYTSLLTRLTRTFDSLNSDSDGKNYVLPTATNTLELYNGSTKLTTDVVFGLLGETVKNYKTVDGLTLTIDKNTGAITLSDASTPAKWTGDSANFILTATLGLNTYSSTYTVNKIKEGGTAVDLNPPSAPTNLKVSGGTSFIFVSVDVPTYTVGHGHKKTKIYALSKKQYPNAVDQIFANATLKSEFTGTIGSFETAANTDWLVWASWVTIDGKEGNTAGPVLASSSLDTTALVDAVLAGSSKQFEVVETSEVRYFGTPQQIVVPAGVYAKAAFITDGFITNAKIADAAITSAKVLNLDAIHLTAGDGTIGGVLKSGNYNYLLNANGNPIKGINQNGWAIFPDGTVDFAAADIRGRLTADQIDGTGLSIRRRNADGTYTTILDSGSTIQQQINNYAVNASSGITLNFDPTCSNTTAWNSANIATITDGITGNKVLAGSNGEHLFEGITINKAYTINYDPKKRYQLSALIRKTAGAVKGTVHLGLLEVDTNNTTRYDWGGYLAGKFAVNNLTTEFKRYYAYFAPGDLHSGVSKVIVHTVLGYSADGTGTGGGRVEMQDIVLEDISLGHAIQYQTVTTAAVDSTVKSTAVLNTTQSNMGINSWIVNRYSVTTAPGTIPDYTLFANTTPIQTVTFTDAAYLNGNTIFGANYDNYIGVATCNVYCEAATTWNTTVSGDDGHNLYVNGVSVIKSGTVRGATAVTINFPKGWSTVEAVWCEQAGADGFVFGTKISATTGIKEMWAFVGGTSATNGIAASAATTSTWAGTVNIPYDKIFATDATTTLGFNPSFELWTGVYPDKWDLWDGTTAPIKETTTTRFGTNAIKYVANGQTGLGIQRSSTWTQPMPKGTFISGTIDLNLLAVTRGLPGILVRLFTKVFNFNNPELNTYIDTLVQPTNALNTWQRVPFTARVGLTEQIYGVQVFIMGSWSGFSSGAFTGTVVFDGLTFAFFDNTIDNKDITVDSNGKLTGTGATDVVVNNQKINVDSNGKLTGTGATDVVVNNQIINVDSNGKLTGTGATDVVVNNQKITISGTGTLTGIGTGVNTVVANNQINVDSNGKLTGTGATDVVVNNQKINVDSNGKLTGTGATDVVVDNQKIIVGGTNLLRNSGKFISTKGWASNGGTVDYSTTTKYGTNNTLRIDRGNGGGAVNTSIMRLKQSSQYTVSAIVKGTAAIASAANTTLHIQLWRAEDLDVQGNPTNFHRETINSVDTTVSTNWGQIYQTFTTPASTDLLYCRFYFYPVNINSLYVAFAQLELGNKVTDWSPSPDDVVDAIADVVTNTNSDYISKKAANVLDATLNGGFTIQTPEYANGNGLLISSTGIAAKKDKKDTFVIGNDGDATFRGTVIAAMMKSTDEKFVIDLANKFISISV